MVPGVICTLAGFAGIIVNYKGLCVGGYLLGGRTRKIEERD